MIKLPLTESQVQNQMCEIMTAFEIMIKAKVGLMTAQVTNIGLVDLITIYEDLSYNQRSLILIGEDGNNENLIVRYVAGWGCLIILTSEPCVDYRANMSKINWN